MFFQESDSPTIRQAICSLRLAWLSRLLEEHGYGDECQYLTKIFYKKARFFYGQVIEKDTKGLEPLSKIDFIGPDTDKDYGYDGVMYIKTWLEFHYGNKNDESERKSILTELRSNLSKVFGFGKSSKGKPSIMLNIARTTFESIEKELKTIM